MTDKNRIDDVLTFGIDLEKRRIYFGILESEKENDFGWPTVENVIRGLHKMYELSSAPIEIHMSCPGGDPYEALRLVDEIEAAPVQIKFIGGGLIASAATWIMAVCDIRTLHKNTYVMIHDGSEAYADRHTDVVIESRHSQNLQDRLYDIFEQNSRMPKAFWQDVCQRDLYLTAEETITLGLADKIVQPRKRGALRRVRNAGLSAKMDHRMAQRTVKNLYERINRKIVPKVVLNQAPNEESDPSLIAEEDLHQGVQRDTE
jgi:hypothetical protein